MDLSELVSMLKNAECAKDIDRKREEIGELVPAVKVMFDYDQAELTDSGKQALCPLTVRYFSSSCDCSSFRKLP